MRHARRASWGFVLLIGLAGCYGWESLLPGGPSGVLPGGLDGLTSRSIQESEPNDDFAGANAVPTEAGTLTEVAGTMASAYDIDSYDIGSVAAGDRLTVAFEHGASMDLAAALFDDQGRLLAYNDDRWWQVDMQPRLAVTVRQSSSRCCLAVAASYGATATGSYTATILRESGSVPAARRQIVYLNFRGATQVVLPGRAPADVPAFNAASIDPSLAGQTSAMTDAIVAAVRADFARFDLEVQSSRQVATIPADATVVHFGLYDPNLLGLAESVDAYNADLTQLAIIFTDTFNLFMPLQPTLQEMALAIANVASHEVGHLLGLEHTQDWTELMDTTAPAQGLLDDQDFHTAALYRAIFPIGQQDAPLLLGDALGWREPPNASNIDRPGDLANTGQYAVGRPRADGGSAPSDLPGTGRAADIRPDVWKLLLYGHRSAYDHVSKDLFAVHFRGPAAR